jgi:hypothetical protein
MLGKRWFTRDHSYRKAVIGSTRVARSAGGSADRKHASSKQTSGTAMLDQSDGATS